MKVFDRIAVRALADMFLPRLCCVCGEELGRNETFICLGCLSELPLTYSWASRRNPMSERFNALIERNGYPLQDAELQKFEESADGNETPKEASCERDSYERYVYAVSLFKFVKDGGYRNITYRLKYGSDLAEGRFFSAMLGERAAEASWMQDVDAVVPVPLHWSRKLRRGYNQSEIIASELAKALGAALRTDLLVRRHRTKTQTKLSLEEKARNVAGAFAVNGKLMKHRHQGQTPEEIADVLNLRHILLVDDVFTTGSTLYNCYLPLKKFFGENVRISIATLGLV